MFIVNMRSGYEVINLNSFNDLVLNKENFLLYEVYILYLLYCIKIL